MTSVANTVAMTTFAVHTIQPLIFYKEGLVGAVPACTVTYQSCLKRPWCEASRRPAL